MNRKMVLSLLIGAAVSGVAFYFAFKNVPFGDLIAYLRRINYWWVVPSTVGIMAAFLLRAVRWRYILNATETVGFAGAYHPLMIGFMMNSVLPGRVGEVARPLILRRREEIPFSTGFATVAVERVFDVGLMVALFVFVMATVTIDPQMEIEFSGFVLDRETLVELGRNMSVLALALLMFIVLVSVGPIRGRINRTLLQAPALFFFTPRPFQSAVRERVSRPIAGMVDNLGSGFALLRDPVRIAGCIGLTVLIWVLQVVTYYIVMFGAPGIDITFTEMTAVMVIISFFIALPSAPGYWGIWEAGGVFAMRLFGVPAKEAAGFTLANHVIQMFPVFIAGIVSAWIIGVNVINVSEEKPDPAPAGAGNRI